MSQIKKISLNSNITFDFFHLEEYSNNNADIFVSNYIPTLNNNSKALITFDGGDLSCKGISDSALGYTFSAYREKNNSDELEYITNISDGRLSLIDYNISNQQKYKYYIFKEDEDVTSAANISNEIETCWWDWFIIGLDKVSDTSEVYNVDISNVWSFSLNIDSAEKVQNFNNTQYKNLTKFPKISKGKLNYSSGTLSCLIGSIRNDLYVDNAELLDVWNDFCVSGQLKLLKDRKGHKMIVEIINSSSDTMDETVEQADVITFNWVQIGDSEGMTIIE